VSPVAQRAKGTQRWMRIGIAGAMVRKERTVAQQVEMIGIVEALFICGMRFVYEGRSDSVAYML
jgi:hypothetical protein